MIITAPFYGFDKAKGCSKTPAAILALLEGMTLNESGINIKHKIVEITNPKDLTKTVAETSEKTMILGGDHTITLHAFRGFVQNNPGAGIIIFDAHPDAVRNYHPLYDDLLIGLIKEKLVTPDKIIIVGVRSWTGEEKEFLDMHGVKYFTMKKITLEGIENVSDGVMETALSWNSLYVSVDMDVVDPVFAPAVGAPVPSGLSSREIIYFLQRLALLKNFKIADICEIDAEKDKKGITLALGAKIVKELC